MLSMSTQVYDNYNEDVVYQADFDSGDELEERNYSRAESLNQPELLSGYLTTIHIGKFQFPVFTGVGGLVEAGDYMISMFQNTDQPSRIETIEFNEIEIDDSPQGGEVLPRDGDVIDSYMIFRNMTSV